ncbi:MAG: hypothetical protein ACXWNK_11815 [Vulcanimicrobiaceae bacterium]
MRYEIEVMDEVQVPAAVIAPVVDAIVRAMIEGKAPYESVRLSMALQELQLDVDATVSVPIQIRGEARSAGAQHWFDISFEAVRHAELFPRFSGTVFVNPNGPSKAEVWLRGTYEPPFGQIGQQVDATLLRGIAERALRQFLDRVAGDALERAQASEREIARMHFHNG